jgi:hypothetical protein
LFSLPEGQQRMVQSYGALSAGNEERASPGFERSAGALDFSFVACLW